MQLFQQALPFYKRAYVWVALLAFVYFLPFIVQADTSKKVARLLLNLF